MRAALATNRPCWLAAAEAFKAVKLAKKKAADSGADPLAIVIRNG